MNKMIFSLLAIISLAFVAKAQDGYQVGATITDFSLKNINDQNVALADYKDAKGFIIIFTCNHCPFAKAYEDRIEALNKKYAPTGYPVIAINPNDVEQYPEDALPEMKIRAQEKGFTFPYLYDETQAVAKAFGALRTPHVFIAQKEGGNLVVKYIGTIDDNWENPSEVKEKYAEQAVDALLAGQPVAVQTTKAIGCSIKWKK
jgi:peroxiredoxin